LKGGKKEGRGGKSVRVVHVPRYPYFHCGWPFLSSETWEKGREKKKGERPLPEKKRRKGEKGPDGFRRIDA